MRYLRFSLFSKIMFWFFLNLLLLGAVLLFVFKLNFGFDPRSRFFGDSSNRIETISRLISIEIGGKSRQERDEVLKRYAEAYRVEFFIFDGAGVQLAGREVVLPPEVASRAASHPFPPWLPPPPALARQPEPRRDAAPPRDGEPPGKPPGPGRAPVFSARSDNPSLYWWGTTVFVNDKEQPEQPAILLTASDSFSGHGIFFDPTPWLALIGVITIVSILFWLPFVRNITGSIAQLTNATERIAEEEFDVRVKDKRTDEIGRLGKAINHLAARLNGFVTGQKRFLGDISHELNSPLARMQYALSILENRVSESDRAYVADVQEEVELMSKLVRELLAYSRAGLKTSEINLERIRLRPLIVRAVEREAEKATDIKIEIDENLEALAQPELLSRALANVIRNAVRYAGNAGAITTSAASDNGHVRITVADNGAGVPEAEIEKLFDPFYRIESDRARKTGGTGLGLAIVKSCVEACQGKVSARNLAPSGFEVTILLKRE